MAERGRARGQIHLHVRCTVTFSPPGSQAYSKFTTSSQLWLKQAFRKCHSADGSSSCTMSDLGINRLFNPILKVRELLAEIPRRPLVGAYRYCRAA